MTNAIISALASVAMMVSPPAPPSQCHKTCAMSEQGMVKVRGFEGYSPFIYKDSAGLDTIGFGHLIRPGEKVTEPLLGDAAEKLLRDDMRGTEKGVNRLVGVPLHQHQFDALGSFTFNVGVGALQRSTLLKRVNAERHKEVPAQFLRWINAGGQPVLGLKVRRKAEAELYSGG